MEKEIAIKILDRFTSGNKENWLGNPFKAFGKTIASSGFSAVVLAPFGDYPDMEHKVGIFGNINNLDLLAKFSAKAIKEVMDTLDKVDEGETLECDACDGAGVVDFEFHYDRKTYTEEEDCPVCDGSGTLPGKKNGVMVFKREQSVKLVAREFLTDRIEELLFVCDTLDIDIITMFKSIVIDQYWFQVGEALVLLMPLRETAEKMVEAHPFHLKLF